MKTYRYLACKCNKFQLARTTWEVSSECATFLHRACHELSAVLVKGNNTCGWRYVMHLVLRAL
jgi:hypothetical protein